MAKRVNTGNYDKLSQIRPEKGHYYQKNIVTFV